MSRDEERVVIGEGLEEEGTVCKTSCDWIGGKKRMWSLDGCGGKEEWRWNIKGRLNRLQVLMFSNASSNIQGCVCMCSITKSCLTLWLNGHSPPGSSVPLRKKGGVQMVSHCDQEGEATQTQKLLSELWAESQLSVAVGFFFFFLYLFIWMHWVLVVAQRIFSLHCGMETLSGGMWWQLPDQGLNLGPLHWELSLSQCTTRGSPDTGLFIAWRISDYLSFSWHSECSPPDLFFMHWTLMMWTIWVPVIVQAVDSHQLYRV